VNFGESYSPSEFLAFRHRLAVACKRLRWDKTDLNNFSLQIIANEPCDDLHKCDWEHLLACMEDLPTPPPLKAAPAAPQPVTPDATLLAFVQLASSEELHGLYRAISKRLHPDVGGDAAKMLELNLLWKSLEKTHGTR
jgi:hypothetical protein